MYSIGQYILAAYICFILYNCVMLHLLIFKECFLRALIIFEQLISEYIYLLDNISYLLLSYPTVIFTIIAFCILLFYTFHIIKIILLHLQLR